MIIKRLIAIVSIIISAINLASAQNEYLEYLCFTAEEDSEFGVTFYGAAEHLTFPYDIQYSKDGINWEKITHNTPSVPLMKNESVYLKGQNNCLSGRTNDQLQFVISWMIFTMSGKIKASGNIMSLVLDSDNNMRDYIPSESCFYYTFNGCSALTEAPDLPAKTLTNNCYQRMFYNCNGLIKGPRISAETMGSYSCTRMFYGCSNLTEMPDLVSKKLALQSCSEMFYNCSSLTKAPKLPATELAEKCYYSMFYGCTSLTQAPELPATKMKPSCYSEMFYNCSSLTQAPELPATELAESCYYNMFDDCSSLTQAPELPATQLAEKCYGCMFFGCSSLTQAPELPATELAEKCYSSMFDYCSSLTHAPKLPATELAKDCYLGMFMNCLNLQGTIELPAENLVEGCYKNILDCEGSTYPKFHINIKVNFKEWNNNYTSNWIHGTRSGYVDTLFCPRELPENSQVSSNTIWISADYLKIERSSNEIYITLVNEINDYVPEIYWSNNGNKWTKLEINTRKSTYTAKITSTFLRGVNSSIYPAQLKIESKAPVKLSGNIMSLVDEGTGTTEIPSENCFKNLFKGNSLISEAPDTLFATTLKAGCYDGMFEGTGITKAPVLLASEMEPNCYTNMFKNSKLEEAPELPAEKLAQGCYAGMMEGCSLYKTPALKAKELADSCYANMFKNNPNLKWTRVDFGNWHYDDNPNATYNWLDGVAEYGLFVNDDKELPTSSEYRGPSYIPEKWAINPDYLSFTARNGDASISIHKVGDNPALEYSQDGESWDVLENSATITQDTKYFIRAQEPDLSTFNTKDHYQYFQFDGDVEASGNVMTLLGIYNSESKTVPQYSFYKLFSNCKTLTTAPLLPATNLGAHCYDGMFSNCAALTTAPLLPAEKLSKGCYNEMFSGCSNLNDITVGFKNWNNGESTQNWLKGVAGSGTFHREGLPTRKGDSYIPESWLPKLNIEQNEEFDDEEGFCGAEIIIPLKFSNGNRPRYYSTDNETFYEFEGDDLSTGDVVFKIDINSVKPGNREYNVFLKDDIEDPDVLGSITIRAKLNLPKEYIEKMYNDIVYVNNGEHIFVDYTWHDNSGKVLSNKQMYQDKNLPKNGGKYSVDVTTTEGFRLKICPQEFSPSSITKNAQITATPYPNPARAGEEVAIDISGSDDSQNIKVYIYNSLGTIIRTIEGAANTIKTTLPAGIYTGKASAGSSNSQFKLIVK